MIASRIACYTLLIWLSGCSSQAENDSLITAYFTSAHNWPVKGIALEPTVSTQYIQSLENIAPVVERSAVETATHVIIADHVVIRSIERTLNTARIQAEFGPHLRFAGLGCGTPVTIHLTRTNGRWVTKDNQETVC